MRLVLRDRGADHEWITCTSSPSIVRSLLSWIAAPLGLGDPLQNPKAYDNHCFLCLAFCYHLPCISYIFIGPRGSAVSSLDPTSACRGSLLPLMERCRKEGRKPKPNVIFSTSGGGGRQIKTDGESTVYKEQLRRREASGQWRYGWRRRWVAADSVVLP